MEDEYNVNGYTDEQLLNILDLNNPSDRELEAKILSMIRKYSNFGNSSGDKLSQFFIDIYNRFFENDVDEYPISEKDDITEGFETENGNTSKSNVVANYNGPEIEVGSEFKTYEVNGGIVGNGNAYNSGVIGTSLPSNVTTKNIFSSSELSQQNNGVLGIANMGYRVTPSKDNIQLTKPIDYSKDSLNPLLKQTIKRIISIDSQYRNQQNKTPSTNFTFNLSEPLKDVVSLSLYSVQIPYTWYTVNSDFGGNFFYLKGNSPGINDGNHDYMFSVTSGNYTPSGLINAVNSSIKNVASTFTDISFGNTRVIYNNGSTDTNNGPGKCELIIDIKKIYNECNYSLYFPSWTNLPLNSTNRLNTIPAYLGFNNQTYYCSSIKSYYTFPYDSINDKIKLETNSITFKIIPYVGSNFINADACFNEIPISFNTTSFFISKLEIVNSMNDTLRYNKHFDKDFTSCTIEDNSSNSYINFDCKLNNSYAPIVENLKLVAVFDSSYTFCGPSSVFGFSDFDIFSNKYICEFNELISETPILQTTYDTSNTFINLICIAPGYSDIANNIYQSLQEVTQTKLSDIINIIKIQNDNSNLSASLDCYSDSNDFLNIRVNYINNVFSNSDYYMYTTANSIELRQMFNLPTNQDSIINEYSSYLNNNYKLTTISFYNKDNFLYFKPNNNKISSGNILAINFKDSENKVYSNGYELADYLTQKLKQYKDVNTNLYPFLNSNIIYKDNKFQLNINISYVLDKNFYKLQLTSNNDIWYNLKFTDYDRRRDVSYNITDLLSNTILKSREQVQGSLIKIIDGSNNTFQITPSNKVNVFNTSNNKYLINIQIPSSSSGIYYTVNQLITEINKQLDKTIAKGTTFSIVTINGLNIIKCRFNINQIFKTKDYKLVFYDPYSFTSCFSNNSKSPNISLQNATWDTTLGWLMGYRNEISYDLSDYVNITAPSGTTNILIYYLKDSSNSCVFIGDTSVSTNLYNYFLIMLDDYVQNHLNDGLVTITNQETSVNHAPFINICDPVTKQIIYIPADYGDPGVTYTQKELDSFNKQVQSQMIKEKSYSKGPFVKDIFGIIPVKTSGMSIGSVYVEFGGSLQNQQRLYFGPVNIHRMTIQLLNDRGNLVDLNNANWSFSFICEQLYKNNIS